MKTPNIDAAEIAKFSELAFKWWDKQGEFKTLHDINPLRIQFIKENNILHNKKIIDLGCGGGILTEALAKEGAIVTGIDMSEPALKIAKLHQKESKLDIEYRLITAEEIALTQPEKYDIVTCLEMLEHVPDPSSVIHSAAKLVKPGGKVFFSTINRNLKSYLFAVIGAEYILKLLPKHTHDYAKFIKPSELASWMRAAKLNPLNFKGLSYNPLSKVYSLSDDTSVNYLLRAEKAL